MEDLSAGLWAFLVIGGPLLLGAALLYGRRRNHRKRQEITAARKRVP